MPPPPSCAALRPLWRMQLTLAGLALLGASDRSVLVIVRSPIRVDRRQPLQ